MVDEGRPFRRGEGVQDDRKGQTHRVGEQRLLLGVGHPHGRGPFQRLLAPVLTTTPVTPLLRRQYATGV